MTLRALIGTKSGKKNIYHASLENFIRRNPRLGLGSNLYLRNFLGKMESDIIFQENRTQRKFVFCSRMEGKSKLNFASTVGNTIYETYYSHML